MDNNFACKVAARDLGKILVGIAIVIAITFFTVFLLGCATDPNHESMDECHYEAWHGHDVKICYE